MGQPSSDNCFLGKKKSLKFKKEAYFSSLTFEKSLKRQYIGMVEDGGEKQVVQPVRDAEDENLDREGDARGDDDDIRYGDELKEESKDSLGPMTIARSNTLVSKS